MSFPSWLFFPAFLFFEVLVILAVFPVTSPSESFCPKKPVAEVAFLNHVSVVLAAVQIGAGAGSKGSAVRRLKWHASWVQNVVRQFGPYLSWALEIREVLTLVREDRVGRAASEPVMTPVVRQGSHARTG